MSDNLPPEELVKALRAEQRALSPSGSGKIISRLINPQGPQAAALIERLEARVAELEGAGHLLAMEAGALVTATDGTLRSQRQAVLDALRAWEGKASKYLAQGEG